MTVKRRLPPPKSQTDGSPDDRVAELRRRFREVDPIDVHDAVRRGGGVLIDVRESDEVAAGSAAVALRLGRGFLELRIESALPDRARAVYLLCDGGARSLFAADSLERLGYENVSTVTGGFAGWRDAGLPVVKPRTLNLDERERFASQLEMPAIGEVGQVSLLEASVLVVGVGRHGAAAAFYLTASGIGRIGIADEGEVERADLQSGILHADDRLGVSRIGSAMRTLQKFHHGADVVPHDTLADADDARLVLRGYDVVVDCSDDADVHESISRACVEHGVPHVVGLLRDFGGEVAILWPSAPRHHGPCWSCAGLQATAPGVDSLGAVAGLIGSLQAVEAIKLVLGVGISGADRALRYDAKRSSFEPIELAPDPSCSVCGRSA